MNRSDDTIRRQAAIDAVEKESQVDGAYGYMDTKSIVDLLMDLPSVQRWIPVSERLPEEKKQVLVCDAYGFIYTAECEVISDDEWLDWRWYESVEYRPMDDVVAWMPLPEPWKGEKG